MSKSIKRARYSPFGWVPRNIIAKNRELMRGPNQTKPRYPKPFTAKTKI